MEEYIYLSCRGGTHDPVDQRAGLAAQFAGRKWTSAQRRCVRTQCMLMIPERVEYVYANTEPNKRFLHTNFNALAFHSGMKIARNRRFDDDTQQKTTQILNILT